MQWTFYLEKLHGSSVFVPGASLKMRKGSQRSFPSSNENKTETLLTGKICFTKKDFDPTLSAKVKCDVLRGSMRLATVIRGIPHNTHRLSLSIPPEILFVFPRPRLFMQIPK